VTVDLIGAGRQTGREPLIYEQKNCIEGQLIHFTATGLLVAKVQNGTQTAYLRAENCIGGQVGYDEINGRERE
jgi:hypothetical protein